MRVIQNAIFLEAHQSNFNPATRSEQSIKYIVCHYTGNINDTAKNNAIYFHETPVSASAHYFVRDESIYQSVKDNHAAYAVGLGARTEPYFKWPSMWKKITNSNSISVEICGSPGSREGSEITKRTAAKLVADLLDKYNLRPDAVHRHYDVTGKVCPAWAVDDPLKWLDFMLLVNNYFNGSEDDEMKDTPENYSVFKTFMDRYNAEIAAKPASESWGTSAMGYTKDAGLMDGTRPRSHVTREELSVILQRVGAKVE